MQKEELKYWVSLSTHQKIGARTFGKLYKRFGNLQKVWKASRSDLEKSGIENAQVVAIEEVVKKIDPDKEMEKLFRYKVSVITLADKVYPKLLGEIFDPPGILYIKGKILPEDEISLAVVGSRKYTTYGERAVRELVYRLASNNLTIISGLALGIDALAHSQTLEAGGRTIAVLGCGLDQIYPVANIRLADKILASGGAIISEFPIGMPALRHHFPIRNRIVAGLSLGTLVIEGAVESGSLITAQAALGYNREVFAVPGSIFSELSEGPNRLIQMGAKMVLSSEDILNELNIPEKFAKLKNHSLVEIIADTKEEEILLKLLSEPDLVDNLIRKSGLEPSVVNSTLILLEMKGKIVNLGGTSYQIKGKLREDTK